MGRPVEAEPSGVETEVVIREVAPLTIEVAPHVQLAIAIHLGDDALSVLWRDAERKRMADLSMMTISAVRKWTTSIFRASH